LFALRTAAGQDFHIPARPERKSKSIANPPAADSSGHAFLPVIVVPRGAGAINALMTFRQRTAARSLTNYGDPVKIQSRVTDRGSPRQVVGQLE
jgi:hypothetical protein